jgi:hypothetical protein
LAQLAESIVKMHVARSHFFAPAAWLVWPGLVLLPLLYPDPAAGQNTTSRFSLQASKEFLDFLVKREPVRQEQVVLKVRGFDVVSKGSFAGCPKAILVPCEQQALAYLTMSGW